jgi:hypothetical protein
MHEVADHECEENRTRVRVISNDRACKENSSCKNLVWTGVWVWAQRCRAHHLRRVHCLFSRVRTSVKMDRWTYQRAHESESGADSAPLAYEKGIRLYDGDERSAFEGGTLTVTS